MVNNLNKLNTSLCSQVGQLPQNTFVKTFSRATGHYWRLSIETALWLILQGREQGENTEDAWGEDKGEGQQFN